LQKNSFKIYLKGYRIDQGGRENMIGKDNAISQKFSHRSQVWDTTGMWAWILHRVTGLGLVFYILLHIVLMSLSLLRGPEGFDETLSLLMGNPFFKFLDTLLLAAVLYHGFNGIRILLFDAGVGVSVKSQKIIFWVLMALAGFLWIWSILH
jgi:succinate dehydrogenase / fumarate reductase, cytochrome b subunit